jgi:hypothetical protein
MEREQIELHPIETSTLYNSALRAMTEFVSRPSPELADIIICLLGRLEVRHDCGQESMFDALRDSWSFYARTVMACRIQPRHENNVGFSTTIEKKVAEI